MEYFETAGWSLWVVAGVALLIADVLLINIYYLIWFGIGAIVTGVLLLLFPDMPVWAQVTVCGVVSFACVGVWLFVVKPRKSGEALRAAQKRLPGERAVVIRFNNGRGSLRLQRPVASRDVWEFTCAAAVNAGDAVLIEAVDEHGVAVAASAAKE